MPLKDRKEYNEYMRGYRQRQRKQIRELKAKAEKYDLLFGDD